MLILLNLWEMWYIAMRHKEYPILKYGMSLAILVSGMTA